MSGERQIKACTVKEAVKRIKDGERIAFGGFAAYNKSMAMVHEIIRAGKRDLTVVGVANSMDVDLLAAAGCIKEVETSYVGLEKYGLAMNFRRSVQEGKVKVTHYPELLSWDRFRANQEGFSFWPTDLLAGSDILKYNDKIVPFKDPMTGRQLWAVPPADADKVIIHMWRGDKYGNLQTQERRMNPQSVDITLSRACKQVIATVEHMVATEELMKAPYMTTVPAFRTMTVSEVRNGSHPTMVLDKVETDEKHFQLYADCSKTAEEFKYYLDKYIYGVESFEQYLELVGMEQVMALRKESE